MILSDVTQQIRLVISCILCLRHTDIPAEYHVLDTDYESFSAVYNCLQLGPERVSHWAWCIPCVATVIERRLLKPAVVFKELCSDILAWHVIYFNLIFTIVSVFLTIITPTHSSNLNQMRFLWPKAFYISSNMQSTVYNWVIPSALTLEISSQ